MAAHSSFLPGECQGQGSLVGCPLWGHTESDTTETTAAAAAADGHLERPRRNHGGDKGRNKAVTSALGS